MPKSLTDQVQNLLAIGSTRTSDEFQLRFVRLCNFMAFIAMLVMTVFVTRYLVQGALFRAGVQVTVIMFFLLPVFLLNFLGLFNAAKFSIVTGCCISTLFDAAAGGSVEGHQYFFIVIASASALLNEPSKWKNAIFGFTFPFFCWLLLEFTDYRLFSNIFPVQSAERFTRMGSIFLSYWVVPVILWRYSFVSMVSERRASRADKMAVLGEMAAGMGHEINNPLAIIKGKLKNLENELDKDGANPENIKVKLHQINDACERISKIIVSLNYFSRDSSEDPLKSVSVSHLVKNTFELCALKAVESDVELNLKENLECQLMGRESELMQILINLISNAIFAASKLEERWVEISYEISSSHVCIKVSDSGTGIPAHVSSRMMLPFFSTKDPGKGTGLGLSISKALAERNFGTLVYNESSTHTQFELRVPRFLS